MIKDKNKEKVLDFVSSMLNITYETQTVGSMAYHIPLIEPLPEKYNDYKIMDVIFYYRLDCLFEKGLITEATKNRLLKLFDYYKLLDGKATDAVREDTELRRRKDNGISKKYELSDEEEHSINLEMERVNKKIDDIYREMDEIKSYFDNYHLLDELNLGEMIANTVRVENNNLDLTSVLEEKAKKK